MSKEIRIIIVEDNPSDADLLHREMKKAGLVYTSVVVDTKDQFEKALDTFEADIILSDYSLPSFDAVTAFFIKQKKCPNIPFIIVSGVFGEEKAVDLIKNGVTDYVPKDNLFTLIPKIHRGLKDSEDRRIQIATDEKLRVQSAELILANMELAFQNREKEKRTEELQIALEQLDQHNKETERRAKELASAYIKLKEAEKFREEYTAGLEEMMFMCSHKVRVPITNILGISEVLDQFLEDPAKLRKSVGFIKRSAAILDTFTKELADTMERIEEKMKNNSEGITSDY